MKYLTDKERLYTDLPYLTEAEREEWVPGYPYSSAFTQGLARKLDAARGKLEAVRAEAEVIRDWFVEDAVWNDATTEAGERILAILKGESDATD